MKLPEAEIIIPQAKLIHYLLVPRKQDDKSKFLAQAGFTQVNPEVLEAAIRELVLTHEAIEDGTNEYGTFYRVDGNIRGRDKSLAVATIWLRRLRDGKVQFITLKPLR